MSQDTIIHDADSAANYDAQARQTNWYGSEVVFGLAYEYVRPGDSLLDLGIGSGLSSLPFHKAGLRIYGLDGSVEILQVCATKNFAVELKLHDLRSLPLPYAPASFQHVISVAVLNSFRDLRPLITEVARITRPGGVFAFTVEEHKPGQAESYPINPVEVAEQPDAEKAVRLYRHDRERLLADLAGCGFVLRKALEFVAFAYPAEGRDVYFKAFVAQKAG